MSKGKISIGQLSNEVQKALMEWKADINEDVRELTDKNIKEATKTLKARSNVSKHDVVLKGGRVQVKGSYKKAWSYKIFKNTGEVYSKQAYNKRYYRLTHLLEFGHALRQGGRARAFPHIRKTEDEYLQKFEKELLRRIKSG